MNVYTPLQNKRHVAQSFICTVCMAQAKERHRDAYSILTVLYEVTYIEAVEVVLTIRIKVPHF